jgi:hypothetical protein
MTQAPQWTPPPADVDPKAAAKAAKAYAKATRPWYKKKRYILGGIVALIVVIAVANSGGGGSHSTTTDNPLATSSKHSTDSGRRVNGTGPSALPIQNGDWRMDSIRVKNDGLGDFGGVARVTYTGDDQDGGDNIFTVTVFKHGRDVAVLNGSANTVLPGHTVTVDLISTDKFVQGPYKYDFQNDL